MGKKKRSAICGLWIVEYVDASREPLEVSVAARENGRKKRNHLCKINKYALCFVPLLVRFGFGTIRMPDSSS